MAGRMGVMKTSAKGAFDAAGLTIGILPGTDETDVNPYIKIALPTVSDCREILSLPVPVMGQLLLVVNLAHYPKSHTVSNLTVRFALSNPGIFRIFIKSILQKRHWNILRKNAVNDSC